MPELAAHIRCDGRVSAPSTKAHGGTLPRSLREPHAIHETAGVPSSPPDRPAKAEIDPAGDSSRSKDIATAANRAAGNSSAPDATPYSQRAGGAESSPSPTEDPHADANAAEGFAYARLALAAEQVSAAEALRIATENRLRAFTSLGAPDSALKLLRDQVEGLAGIERMAIRDLERGMREHPLGEWVAGQYGIGAKTAARLLGAIGDPAWNTAEDRPRHGHRELWSYCGLGDAAVQKRRKGQKSNWNAEAKKRVWLIATTAIKQRQSPYRPVYDDARASWADREISDGHKHAHALRLVGKAFLRDLFFEAKARLA